MIKEIGFQINENFLKNISEKNLFVSFIFLGIEINEKSIKNTLEKANKYFKYKIIKIKDEKSLTETLEKMIAQEIDSKIYYYIIITNKQSSFQFSINDKNIQEKIFKLKLINGNLTFNLLYIITKIFESIKLYLKDFYKTQKIYFTANENLNEENIFKKIVFDVESLDKKEKKNIDLKNFTLIDFDEEQKKEIEKIGKEYYDNLKKAIENILKEINIKNGDTLLKSFIDEKKFKVKFNELITNLKCKCLYNFFWIDFLIDRIKDFLFNTQLPIINIAIK